MEWRMEAMTITVDCPYCGEATSLDADLDLEAREPGAHRFVQDCNVCCRPISATVTVDANGEIDFSYARD
jgi:hypothetical protein